MSNTMVHVHASGAAVSASSTALFTAHYVARGQRQAALSDPYTLAVFEFGNSGETVDDPRWLRVPLAQLGPEQLEVWRSPSPVTQGRTGNVRWSHNGHVLFAALEIDEFENDIEDAAASAYSQLSDFQSGCGYPHLQRVWNYLDAVTEGEGDHERYRQFCIGRVRGLQQLDESALPAATCVGRFDGVRRLQVYWLAAREPGYPLENPRQVSAYAYPRQYGPQSPSFARALLPAATSGLPLLQSGTAAIVGHSSKHPGALGDQLHETLLNLQSLVDTARQQQTALSPTLGPGSLLKVYVRHAADMPAIAAQLQAENIPDESFIVLHAEVCRAELLVEIEGMHR